MTWTYILKKYKMPSLGTRKILKENLNRLKRIREFEMLGKDLPPRMLQSQMFL